jgi:hypothetical protein
VAGVRKEETHTVFQWVNMKEGYHLKDVDAWENNIKIHLKDIE